MSDNDTDETNETTPPKTKPKLRLGVAQPVAFDPADLGKTIGEAGIPHFTAPFDTDRVTALAEDFVKRLGDRASESEVAGAGAHLWHSVVDTFTRAHGRIENPHHTAAHAILYADAILDAFKDRFAKPAPPTEP